MATSVEVYTMPTPHHDPIMFDQNKHSSEELSNESEGAYQPTTSASTGKEVEVTKPGEHDVLLGRGGGTNNHSGNIKFRKLVNEHKMRYLACSKVDKPKVAREVVQIWRKLTPPGRFLTRKDDTKRGPGSVKAADNVWIEVGDKKAREKASQCLRERTPEVMPYIKHLREQQDAITEQGVSMVQHHLQLQQEGSSPRHLSPQHVHPTYSQQHFSPQARSPMVAQQAFPGRRTAMPVPPDPGMMGQMAMPHQQQSMSYQSPVTRRGSFGNTGFNSNHPATGLPMVPTSDFRDGNELSSYNYQQDMMMMQQQQQHHQQQQQQQQLEQMRHMQQQQQQQLQQQHTGMAYYQQAQQPQLASNDADPYVVHSSDPLMNNNTTEPKRSREAPADRSAPDRAISLMSLTQDEGGEVTIESYRKQLEEYLERADVNNSSNPVSAFAEDHEYASDLEDDWEKEREKNLQQHGDSSRKQRGVDRNTSGFSLMSAKTTKSNLSMISGISASFFADMSGGESVEGATSREQKMQSARSVCSNISLMSELTDLSENLDNLGLE